jgi:hypothetical protein
MSASSSSGFAHSTLSRSIADCSIIFNYDWSDEDDSRSLFIIIVRHSTIISYIFFMREVGLREMAQNFRLREVLVDLLNPFGVEV